MPIMSSTADNGDADGEGSIFKNKMEVIQSRLDSLVNGQVRVEEAVRKMCGDFETLSLRFANDAGSLGDVKNIYNVGANNTGRSCQQSLHPDLVPVLTIPEESDMQPLCQHAARNSSESTCSVAALASTSEASTLDTPSPAAVPKMSSVSEEEDIEDKRKRSLKEINGTAQAKAKRRQSQIDMIVQLFQVDEAETRKSRERKAERVRLRRTSRISRTCEEISKESGEMMLDTFMACVICANSIFLGFQLDHKDTYQWDVWRAIEIIFCIIFWTEMFCRLRLHGRDTFRGREGFLHCADFALILLDSLQLFVEIFFEDKLSDGMPSASVFRVVRLCRICRILRLLPTTAFKDLLAMMQGLTGGLSTLSWALLVFVILVYTMALVCKEVFGTIQKNGVDYYFETVPRSMLTIFRCSFGDCSSRLGVPIPETITTHYGGTYGFFYCGFLFFMTVGLFNVISAIFVDSTMAVAAQAEKKSKQDRLEDPIRWSRNVATIVKRLLAVSTDHSFSLEGQSLSESVDDLLKTEMNTTFIDLAVHDQETLDALHELEIDPDDHKKLSDILDPDHNGAVGLLELVNGLCRLRGQPRRSDIVTVDLMVRSLQETVIDVMASLDKVRRTQEAQIKCQEAWQHSCMHELKSHLQLAKRRQFST